jgi:hypothetical protein
MLLLNYFQNIHLVISHLRDSSLIDSGQNEDICPSIKKSMPKLINFLIFSGADEDEISKKFLEVLNEADISSKLKKANAVCIKIQNGTESCTQFSQIYPVILVSVQGVESLWGDGRFIPADWGS